jgi:hypothetical protein
MRYLIAKKNDTSIFGSDQAAFHGLRVDREGAKDGLLTYSKVLLSSGESVTLADYGVPYNGIDDANAGTANAYIRGSSTELDDRRTPGGRKYDGARFDGNKLTYYMNADGFLVARYFAEYTYNSGSAGQTRNWTE